MQNTTSIGDELRDYVISLLEARGYPVRREIRLDTKKIDILFEQEDDLTCRRVAVEVKNYSKNLSQEELTQIYTSHLSLLQTRAIDELWVLVRTDYSPEAKNWASRQLGLRIYNLPEFEERQFGFRNYARQLSSIFHDERLSEYYIPQRSSKTTLLRDQVLNWIYSASNTPLAIIAGYGTGKTSFCKYITHELCNEYLADSMKRVPIYIRLSDIAHEQDLEGLLGKILGSRFKLNNYHFHDIMSLNSKGKFVFVFDGFDEMRHALTWDMFNYNLMQINRTVSERSKVIITGRPNYFLSDSEHISTIKGIKQVAGHTISLPGRPSYDEISISPFSEPESVNFLRRYLKSKILGAGRRPTVRDNEWIEGRLSDFRKLGAKDELTRPVHLKVFADIAANRELTLSAHNIFELYEIAAEMTFEREMDKAERIPIPAATRKEILQDVAWWLWRIHGGRTLHFHPREVPRSVLSKLPEADNGHNDSVIREVFSGVFLERKHGDNFYFSHRSFLEFFVAKFLLDRARSETLSVNEISSVINKEIIDFVRSSGKDREFFEYLFSLIQTYSGPIRLMLLTEIRAHVLREQKRLGNEGPLHPHTLQPHIDALLDAIPLYQAFSTEEITRQLSRLIENLEQSESQVRAKYSLFFLIDSLVNSLDKYQFQKYASDVCRFLISKINFSRLRGKSQYQSLDYFEELFLKCAAIDVSKEDLFAAGKLKSKGQDGREYPTRKVERIKIDFRKMLKVMSATDSPKITIADKGESAPDGPQTLVIGDDAGLLTEADRVALLSAIKKERERDP